MNFLTIERLDDIVHGGMLFTFIIASFYFLRVKSYTDKPVRLYYAMGALMKVLAIQTAEYIIISGTNEELTDHHLLAIVINLYAAPFCVFVIKELVCIHKVTPTKIFIQAGIPLLLMIAYYELLLSQSPWQTPVLIIYLVWMTMYIIIYTHRSVKSISTYEKIIGNVYADINGRDINWLKRIVVYFILIMVLFLLLKVVIGSEISRLIYAIMGTAFWVSLCWQVSCMKNNESATIDEDEILRSEECDTEAPVVPHEQSDEEVHFLDSVHSVLLQDRLYASEELTREILAKRMGINYKYLTSRLKTTTGLTFSAYVTEIRMEEAVRMLTSTDMTVEEVFYACGYNSKSTFYRAFTKKYGCTPKEYRRKGSEMIAPL